jgi:hypothetical protein
MKTVAVLMAITLAGAGVASNADARGCVRGAVVGGVIGHFAGHHALLGAAAGCVIGHHYASRHRYYHHRHY